MTTTHDVPRTDYVYILAWGALVGSYAYYIAAEIEQAKRDKAPWNAIYKQDRDEHGAVIDPAHWRTVDQIPNEEVRERIEQWVRDYDAGRVKSHLTAQLDRLRQR